MQAQAFRQFRPPCPENVEDAVPLDPRISGHVRIGDGHPEIRPEERAVGCDLAFPNRRLPLASATEDQPLALREVAVGLEARGSDRVVDELSTQVQPGRYQPHHPVADRLEHRHRVVPRPGHGFHRVGHATRPPIDHLGLDLEILTPDVVRAGDHVAGAGRPGHGTGRRRDPLSFLVGGPPPFQDRLRRCRMDDPAHLGLHQPVRQPLRRHPAESFQLGPLRAVIERHDGHPVGIQRDVITGSDDRGAGDGEHRDRPHHCDPRRGPPPPGPVVRPGRSSR